MKIMIELNTAAEEMLDAFCIMEADADGMLGGRQLSDEQDKRLAWYVEYLLYQIVDDDSVKWEKWEPGEAEIIVRALPRYNV